MYDRIMHHRIIRHLIYSLHIQYPRFLSRALHLNFIHMLETQVVT